jgi:hypothetical protein
MTAGARCTERDCNLPVGWHHQPTARPRWHFAGRFVPCFYCMRRYFNVWTLPTQAQQGVACEAAEAYARLTAEGLSYLLMYKLHKTSI